ncbi:hypothetical protein [Labilibaculum manganireducens]|uniref:hypothetical protein n=1 Tax=Labilibaculum manganireducens TaxID=1940525 RepID=UPI0029F4F8B5|nr:hypothetical protein [Labilibaculum manganireducens]
MKKFIKAILNVNSGLLILFFFTFAFCLQLLNTDFVINDKVWYEYLAQKEDQKYNDEYDQYIADFEEDLKGVDLPEEDDAYGWDFLLMDSVMILAPFIIVCIGLAALIFISFQFTEQLKHIKFSTVFKSSILAYLIFFLDSIFKAIYFLIFKSNYQYEDIQHINDRIAFSLKDAIGFSDKESILYDIFRDLNLYLLAYILLIPLFLKLSTNLSYKKLALNIFIPFICGFALYESVMAYTAL